MLPSNVICFILMCFDLSFRQNSWNDNRKLIDLLNIDYMIEILMKNGDE